MSSIAFLTHIKLMLFSYTTQAVRSNNTMESRENGIIFGATRRKVRARSSSYSKASTPSTTSWSSNFETFCNCTSLHGWKYLSHSVNKTLRFVLDFDLGSIIIIIVTLRLGWILVVLASMGVASFFLGYSFNDFVSSTVQTTQDTSR